MADDHRADIAELEKRRDENERAAKGTAETFNARKEKLYDRIGKHVTVGQMNVFIGLIAALILICIVFGIWIDNP